MPRHGGPAKFLGSSTTNFYLQLLISAAGNQQTTRLVVRCDANSYHHSGPQSTGTPRSSRAAEAAAMFLLKHYAGPIYNNNKLERCQYQRGRIRRRRRNEGKWGEGKGMGSEKKSALGSNFSLYYNDWKLYRPYSHHCLPQWINKRHARHESPSFLPHRPTPCTLIKYTST